MREMHELLVDEDRRSSSDYYWCCERRVAKKPLWFFILVLVIAVTTVTVIVVATRDRSGSGGNSPINDLPKFGFEQIFDSKTRPHFGDVHWVSAQAGDAYVETAPNGDIQVNVVGGASSVLVPKANIPENLHSYEPSPGLEYVMFATDFSKIYRHSFTARYVLYNVATQTSKELHSGSTQVQLAQWSPDGAFAAYVFENDIFIVDSASGAEVQVTHDGAANQIRNGVCDWAYEEEVYSATSCLWWSPNNTAIAYLRFDETNVREVNIPLYAFPYDSALSYKYPQPGGTISTVSLGLITKIGDTPVNNLVPKLPLKATDYATGVDWFSEQAVTVKVMNNTQNAWTLYKVGLGATNVTVTAMSSESHPRYLEPTPGSVTSLGEQLGLYADLMVKGDRVHIGLFHLADGTFYKWLTNSSDWDVLAILGTSLADKMMYFGANVDGSKSRAIYGVSLANVLTVSEFPIHRLLAARPGLASFQSASFALSATAVVINEMGPEPFSKLYELTVDQGVPTATLVSVLNDNSVLEAELAKFQMPSQEYTSTPSTVDPAGPELNVRWTFPPNYDPQDKCAHVYPVIMFVYGGPGSQQVTDQFTGGGGGNNGWMNYMAGSHDVAIVVVDGIGTGGQGDKFQKEFTYKKLGVNEAIDVYGTLTSYVHSQCYVDNEKVALWGWSFGGFLSSMVAGMTRDTNKDPFFKAITAVAPVTHWQLYDTIYTERYMQSPATNALGYNESSALDRVHGIQNNQVPLGGDNFYQIIHGLADDNVHFQNAALLVKKLVKEEVQFQSFYYPNRDHSLRDPTTLASNRHLYRLLTNRFLNAFEIPVTITQWSSGRSVSQQPAPSASGTKMMSAEQLISADQEMSARYGMR